MQAALGVSTLPSSEAAGRNAAERVVERLGGGPDLTLLLASAAHGRDLPRLVDAAAAVLGRNVVGASVEGIVAPGVEVSDYPAVLALGLRGARAAPFFVHDAAGEEARVAEEIAAQTVSPGAGDLVCMFVDSQSVDVAALAQHLPEGLDGATVLGTGAAPPPRGRPLLFCDGERGSGAISGFVVRNVRTSVSIVQAGHPVTPRLAVTRARGNWVTGLDGRPALDVYQEAVRSRGLRVDPGAPPPLLAGLVSGPDGDELVVRNVVGIDAERGAFSLPVPMFSGQSLRLVELDAEVAREDMTAGFGAAARREPRPDFGLYLNCRARGASLFGQPGVEATCLANTFADCSIAGISSPFQLAPTRPGLPGSPLSVLTYAGALALLSDERDGG